MALFTIQDMTGIQELLAFPGSFARFEQILKPGKPLLMKVRVLVEESGTRLSLEETRLLEEMNGRPDAFRVRLELKELSEETLDSLEELFLNSPGPCQVVFEFCHPDGSVALLQTQTRVKVTPELVEAVRQVCGDHAVVAAGA